MERKLDKKFTGSLMKVKDGTIVPGDEWVAFLAKDNAFAAVLPAYRQKCQELGCADTQLTMVDALIEHVATWRAEHPKRLKNPDAAGEKILP